MGYLKQLVTAGNQIELPDLAQYKALIHDLLTLLSRQGQVQIKAEARELEDALHVLTRWAVYPQGLQRE